MQQISKTAIIEIGKRGALNMKPVCFYCNSLIKAGEEVISRRNKGYYHRKCYDLLFTLKSTQVVLRKKM